jgi:cystathionine gamma-synthase
VTTTQGFSTRAIHAGQDPDSAVGSVVPPIYATSTFIQDKVGEARGGYEYSRSSNPTRTALEECMAALEGGKHGLAFASGLAAEDTLLRTIASPGSHFVVPDDAYGGTFRLFARVHERWGIAADPAHLTNLDSIAAAIVPGETKAIWIETPTNPLLNIADIAAIVDLAHAVDALVIVDNTFATPYLQQPFEFGADVVVHSTTKYCGGHSDVIGGALVVNDDELAEQLRFHQNAIGGVASPFDWSDTATTRSKWQLSSMIMAGSRRCTFLVWTPIPGTTLRSGRCADTAAWSASASLVANRLRCRCARAPQ